MIQTPKSNFGSKVTQRLAQDIYGIEILKPSTSGNNTNPWFVTTRGASRYVDELRYNDPDYSPENFEVANYGSIEETHGEQPTIQSRSQCSQSEDHIPFHKREWIDITANEYTLEEKCSRLN